MFKHVEHTQHSQYVFAKMWESLIARFSGLKHSYSNPVGSVLDATRHVYNILLTDFIELTAEVSKLWDEIRMMRAYTTEMERKLGIAYGHRNEAMQTVAELKDRVVNLDYIIDNRNKTIDELQRTVDELRKNVAQLAPKPTVWGVTHAMRDVQNISPEKVRNSLLVDGIPPKQRAARAELEAKQRRECLQRNLRNHNTPWTPTEIDQLQRRYLGGCSLAYIATLHGREWEAVLYKLARIGGWPFDYRSSSKFLDFAWTWFFSVQGSALGTEQTRATRLSTVPRKLP